MYHKLYRKKCVAKKNGQKVSQKRLKFVFMYTNFHIHSRFIAVMHADQDGVVPGNALVVDPKKQFRPLSKFGNAFLNRFQCSNTKSEVLKGISIVDTPGILSGEKQRTDRGYDFIGVLEWFAERVDRILLLFDAHKLDISDEFKRSIEALRNHDDKIR